MECTGNASGDRTKKGMLEETGEESTRKAGGNGPGTRDRMGLWSCVPPKCWVLASVRRQRRWGFGAKRKCRISLGVGNYMISLKVSLQLYVLLVRFRIKKEWENPQGWARYLPRKALFERRKHENK